MVAPSFSVVLSPLLTFLAKEILLAKENYFFNEYNEVFEKMVLLYVPGSLVEWVEEEELNLKKKMAFKDFGILIDSNNYAALNAQENRIMIQ